MNVLFNFKKLNMYKEILLIPWIKYRKWEKTDIELSELWEKQKNKWKEYLKWYSCRICKKEVTIQNIDIFDSKIKCNNCNILLAHTDLVIKDYKNNPYRAIINIDLVWKFEKLYYRRKCSYDIGLLETEQLDMETAFKNMQKIDKEEEKKVDKTNEFAKYIY